MCIRDRLQTSKGLFEFGAAVADERAEARDWMNEHIQPGDRICLLYTSRCV